jgi:hypothetical protein
MKVLKTTLFLSLLSFISMAQLKPDSTAVNQEEVSIENAFDMIHHLEDTTQKIQLVVGHLNQDLTYSGTRLIGRESTDSLSQLTTSGYVSTYIAHYSDSVAIGSYEKFPTVAPYSDAFSINIAQLSTRFVSQGARANLTLQYGDIPNSAWSSRFTNIQEANAGIRLVPRLWLDAGFFRTHIGLESIQPRENIASSIAVITYYEPYLMSGLLNVVVINLGYPRSIADVR